jgi:hypothetical protein
LVPASFSSTSLVLVAGVDADGPHLDAVPAGGVGWDSRTYDFELDADEIVARLPASATLSRQRHESANRRRQPQSDRVRWAFLRMFPNGQIPSVYTSILESDIIRELTSEAGRIAGMDDRPYPSPDVIDRVRRELSF